MKQFKKHVVAASVAAVMGLTVTSAQAIEVAADHTGQVLLAPLYVAGANESTDIVVVNPLTTHAVLARVAFRSHVNSQEVLDFEIYLSPGDTWRGSVVNENGVAVLTSTDDSMLVLQNPVGVSDFGTLVKRDAVVSFASASTPASFPLFTDKPANYDSALATAGVKKEDDSNTRGHVEIIGAYSIANGSYSYVDTDGNTVKVNVKRGMLKNDLFKLMNLFRADLNAIVGANVSSISPETVQLFGEVSLSFDGGSASGQRMNYTMTALDASDNNNDGVVSPEEMVISNPAYNFTRGSESSLGENFGTTLAGDDFDSIGFIEEALSKRSVFGPWETIAGERSTVIMATFPTRYRHTKKENGATATGSTVINGALVAGCNASFNVSTATDVFFSAPFDTLGEAFYTLSVYDNSENTPQTSSSVVSGSAAPTTQLQFTREVETKAPNFVQLLSAGGITSTSGWYEMSFVQDRGTNCTYAGLPVLATAMKVNLVKDEITAMPLGVKAGK